MQPTSQKLAVRNAIAVVVTNYTIGEAVLSQVITKEQKKEIKAMLFEGFRSNAISFSGSPAQLKDDKYLNNYVSSLLDNWIRKDPDFNLGQKYEIKNKGSRQGSQDEQVRELKKLLKTNLTNEEKQEVETAIKARIAEIKPATVVTINKEALPESLRHLVK